MDPAQVARVAAVAAARRSIGRAVGLLRQAKREIAAASEGVDTVGVTYATDDRTIDEATEIIRLGVRRHRGVDVVVIARPHR